MSKRILLFITMLLTLHTGVNAQKIYELSELKRIPFIEKEHMKTIAISIVDLYKKAIKIPAQNSTIVASENIVYTYYENGQLKKANPHKGVIYSENRKSDIEQNNKLLFNMSFDESGNLVISEKINVISFREVVVDRKYEQFGSIAFELVIPDSLKSIFSKIKIGYTAAIDGNSLTGGLTPVKVLVPFNLTFGNGKTREIVGDIIKNNELINIRFNGLYWNDENTEIEKPKTIELLKRDSELMQYKKGLFRFTLEEKFYDYSIDINIGRGGFWSAQPQSFSTSSIIFKSFVGEGKKIKNKQK